MIFSVKFVAVLSQETLMMLKFASRVSNLDFCWDSADCFFEFVWYKPVQGSLCTIDLTYFFWKSSQLEQWLEAKPQIGSQAKLQRIRHLWG